MNNKVGNNLEGKITRDELRNVLKAMDKDGFENLMGDYIKEISNPENITETNQYLKQAEDTGDLPKNVKLAQPKAGFCLKSMKVNTKRPSAKQKVFVNIVAYDGVAKPNQDSVNRNMWSLPFLINKGRNDQDNKGKLCQTFDIAFHSDAIRMAKDNISFKKFVSDTAVNGINNNLLKENSEKISSDYVIITKYEYKGKEVSYMNIHGLNKGEFDSQLEPKENYQTNLQKEISDMKNTDEDENGDQKVFDKPDTTLESSQKDIDNCGKVIKQKPEYKIIYSDNVDLGKFFYTSERTTGDQYQKLVIEIKVPKLDNLEFAELQIDPKRLNFRFKDIYELDIDLPVEVNNDKSEAKFDRKRNVLSISAEIVRKHKEVLKLKEDENIEFVPDEEVKKEGKETVKREEVKHDDHILVNNKLESETKESGSNIPKEVGGDTTNELSNTKEMPTSEVIKQSDTNHIETKREMLELNNTPTMKDEPAVTEIKKVIELPPQEDTSTAIQTLNNNHIDDDEDDVNKTVSKDDNKKDLNKIVFFNFNCDLIYEID
jgi:dynein assembly factor 2